MLSTRQLFLKHVAQTSDAPIMLEIERGEGVFLYDTNGKRYLDAIAGISVNSLGHCHPKVVKAVQAQAEKYLHTIVYGEFVMSPQVRLAELLVQQLPEQLNCVYFVNSGTEATEGAMKVAKRFTGRTEIISCKNAYHGSTQGALSLMSDDYFTRAYRPLLPDVRHIEFNNSDDLIHITNKTACVVMETVQAESGVNPPKGDYLKKVRQRCSEVGALLVLDEIQVGYGRTGTLFAFEQYGIAPDILLLAKAMGGGMPIGAFVAAKEIMWTLTNNPVLGHITTFGGHPVICAAGLATLETLLATQIFTTVKHKEALFKQRLKHPLISAVRSAGLLMAIELDCFDRVLAAVSACIERGLITDWFLFNDRCLRIAPPLIISEEEIELACAIILDALDALKNNEK